ncbi:MAG: carbohydrate kinase [Sphaerochaetaceae bacterium]
MIAKKIFLIEGGRMKFLSFGEILWDVFSNKRTLGGAPLNVAGHMARLGSQAAIISCVGKDELGDLTLEAIRNLKVDDTFIRQDGIWGTGVALIQLKDGIPTYEFNDPCAWDAIMLTEDQKQQLRSLKPEVFCFGTLAQRSSESRNTLDWLLDNLQFKTVFFDVNLRKAFFDKECIARGLAACSILKMNDEELPIIARTVGIDASLAEEGIVRALQDAYAVRTVLITKGKKGVSCYDGNRRYDQKPQDVKVVDTVGAGDSFSAAFLRSLFATGDIAVALKMGSDLADYVVSHAGAIPEYDETLKANWMKILQGNN